MKQYKLTYLPKVVAFDLDDTLWFPEMWLLDGGDPFRKDNRTGRVFDSANTEIQLFKGVPEILSQLASEARFSDTLIAYASRTNYPEYAYECLRLITLPNPNAAEAKENTSQKNSKSKSKSKSRKKAASLSMKDAGDLFEIYPGDKKKHFRRFKNNSNGAEFDDMIFWDNEYRNCESVSELGVHCVHTPRGLTRELFLQGLVDFDRYHKQKKTGTL